MTTVDAADYAQLSRHRWYLSAYGYAARNRKAEDGPGPNTVWMHREILGMRGVGLVDHINQDRLDNRRSNLRPATKRLNALNAKRRRDNSSGAHGVRWHKAARKWTAEIYVRGRSIYLGLFDTIEEAISARLAAEEQHAA